MALTERTGTSGGFRSPSCRSVPTWFNLRRQLLRPRATRSPDVCLQEDSPELSLHVPCLCPGSGLPMRLGEGQLPGTVRGLCGAHSPCPAFWDSSRTASFSPSSQHKSRTFLRQRKGEKALVTQGQLLFFTQTAEGGPRDGLWLSTGNSAAAS